MIGAGVTLSQIIKQFKSTSSDAGFSYLTEAARYLENVANLQIRNVSRYQNHVKKIFEILERPVFVHAVAVGFDDFSIRSQFLELYICQ